MSAVPITRTPSTARAVNLRTARPLFATLHIPDGAWTGRRVVLCPPLGYEGLFASTTLSHVAAHLAAHAGAAVLVLDYDGTGDSSGTDRDPGRVRAWLDSIHAAVRWLDEHAPSSSPVAVVGLRSGALLAAIACGERPERLALGLWAAQLTGRAFVREQRAFSALTTAGADADSADLGFDCNGFYFSQETAEALQPLSVVDAFTNAPAHLLVMHRAELPIARVIPPHLREPERGCAITEVQTSDFPGLMQAPWLWESPTESTAALVDWACQLPADAAATLRDVESASASAIVTPDATESALRIGRSKLFAILTKPSRGEPRALALLIGATVGYRIGHTRLHVEMARRFAQQGIASLRFDVTGVGGNRTTSPDPPPLPYEPRLTDDVLDAMQWAWDAGYRQLVLHGVCAGAFHAWRAALASEIPVRLVLANLEEYWPIRYTLEEHMRTLAPLEPIAARIARARHPRHLLRLGVELSKKVAKRLMVHVRANAPVGLHRSSFPTMLDTLARRGTATSLLYSAGDQGIPLYRRHAGRHLERLERTGAVALTVVEGADHSITSFAARSSLIEAMVIDLDRAL